MNAAEGLTRIASVIRWGGFLVGVLLLISGLIGGISESNLRAGASVFGIYGITGVLVAGLSAALAWVIDGFAKPKRDADV